MLKLIEQGKRFRRREVIGVLDQQGFGPGKKLFKENTLLLQEFPDPGGRGRGDQVPFIGI